MDILKHKPINWWYFFFWAGIVIPWIFFSLTHFPFLLGYFRWLAIEGANPYINAVFNLSIFLLMTIVFKKIVKFQTHINLIIFLYSLFGLISISFFINNFFPYRIEIEPQKFPRRYLDYTDDYILMEKNSRIINYFYHGSLIIILLIFLFFFIRNFPVFNKKDND